MIKSKICPCSCDSGEIIAAPDGFTFALIVQQGNVKSDAHELNELHPSCMTDNLHLIFC